MKIPVVITTVASHHIGEVDIEKPEDFEDTADALWESQDYDYPIPCHQEKYDLGEWDIYLEDVEWYFKQDKEIK